MGDILRPMTFDDDIGQARVKENIQVFLKAAQMKGVPLEHILLSGMSGCGKSSLAYVIANATGKKVISVVGPTMVKASQLTQLLSLSEGDVFFIDEIHGISHMIRDALLPALEDFKVFIPDAETGEVLEFGLPKFTCIGATTELGLIERPLRERFGISGQIDFLTPHELLLLLDRSAAKLELADIKIEGLKEIARRSRGTPRVANKLLRRVGDFALVENKAIDKEFVSKVLDKLGVDGLGLTPTDKKVLSALAKHFDGGPAGLQSLASAAFESVETVACTCEPYLMKEGFMQRTQQGRIITDKARRYLEL